MTRIHALTWTFVAFLLVGTSPLAAIELESYMLGFGQAWTGNGHVPGNSYDFDVTGSEAMPIDGFFSVGVRILFLESGFISPDGTFSLSPRIELGYRRYALFESGRVSPAPVETGQVAEGNTLGPGSGDVLILRVPAWVTYELRFANESAFYTAVSPTLSLRFPVANFSLRDEDSNLSGMYSYFLGRFRFLMPEIGVGYRFQMSDYLEVTLGVEYGVSVVDLFDTNYPIYDQMRLGAGVHLGFTPPFRGLFRDRDAEQELPPRTEP